MRDEACVAELMQKAQAVIALLPHTFRAPIARQAVNSGIHYVDASYPDGAYDALAPKAAAARVAILPEMGLDPGIDLLLARQAVSELDVVTRLDSYGGGANGKSTMLNIVRSMLGEYAANTPFSTFELQYSNSNTNDLAALADRRLVTAAETNDARRLNESRVKVATGSDPVTARYLYHENFTYIPQFKIWLAMNHKPRITGVDDGIWRRIRLVPYTVSFKDNADYTLESKLRDELPGILSWAVRGCLDWQKQGLNPPDTVKDATESYRMESDPIARFMDECVTQDPNGKVRAARLYKRYCRWADVYNERPVSSTAFGLRMAEGYEKRKSGHVSYLGIKLNETDSSEGLDS